ncbi:15169_t:CDS:2 [Gigaspora margarita]|uniref:15169_t:CDS:1 n=1 Tax=Gigaspora margarita TaxID=4874 RepID=A0ABN7UUC3_GIGMA|nr:15169_t:CDS:2 [Gigaspora margarita]
MTNNQAIFANGDQVNDSVGYPIVFILYMAIQQSLECKTCLYVLLLEAINQFKADFIYIIESKLKEHFKQSEKQTISFSCLESLFFGVFEGYIHYFNFKNGSYKCFFMGLMHICN